MKREYYLELARSGLRMPIAVDLVLHRQPDAEKIVLDGKRLGAVLLAAAKQYCTPLAVPLMNLQLEKADPLRILRIPDAEVERFHFQEPPSPDQIARLQTESNAPFAPLQQAHIESIRVVAETREHLAIGMAIGPFSLMTKLMADPITAIAMAGAGITAAEDAGVCTAESCLALAEIAVRRSLRAQIAAGAAMILICEPAANIVYLSPKQIERGSDVFERFVMQPNLRLKQLLDGAGVDLMFHDCGELSTFMVSQFARRLYPVILSFGSSRKLWEDAAVVPKDVVLFGNLPTKNFYSDSAVPETRVVELTCELIARMRAVGHPHIPGSECDVLHVPESAETIRRKVQFMLTCGQRIPAAACAGSPRTAPA